MPVTIVGLQQLPLCHQIRREVFVEGQKVDETLEIDGLDPECTHFLALEEGVPAGTARLRRTADDHAKIERVAVLEAFRGRGLGHQLMDALEAEARRLGYVEAYLSAQVQVIPFYEARGWQSYDPQFMEAGILHQKMKKRL